MKFNFITLYEDDEEVEWLQNFLEDIPYWTKSMPAIMIYCDNQLVVRRAQSNMYNGKSRHYSLKIRYYSTPDLEWSDQIKAYMEIK